MASPGNGVYWVGADGNYYIKTATSNGVQNLGSSRGEINPNIDVINGLDRIDDPNAPAQAPAPAPTSPNGGGGTTAAAPPTVDKSNDRALQLAGLSAVDQQTTSGISAVDRALANINGSYAAETGANEGKYTTGSNTNQNNLQKNKQSALVNAAQGRQGLFGTLSSIGALNGSGIDLANRAVQIGANEDLSGAGDNFATNQSGLDSSIAAYRLADDERRKQALTAAEDARTRVRGEGAKSKQGYYSNLANDFAAEGNSSEANRYTGMASDLFPEIAASNIPSSNLAYTGAAYTAPSLASYLSGANSTSVGVSGSKPGTGPNSLPGLTAGDTRKKQSQLV